MEDMRGCGAGEVLMDASLRNFLDTYEIKYILHEHPAVFTVAEAEEHCRHIHGLACKNLFLKSDAGRFYLFILPASKKADISAFRKRIGAQKTRFGTPEELKELLGLTPGSVSPFGLVNDTEHKVTVFIDEEVLSASIVTFHPNINTETLELKQEEFQKLFKATGHQAHTISSQGIV
jgi:Ala-tRNA(Pro) deacylase